MFLLAIRLALSVFMGMAGFTAAVHTAEAADGTPPSVPEAMQATPAEGWHATAQFLVSWRNPPPGDSPIAAAHYQLCRGMPLGPCITDVKYATNISELLVTVPGPGMYTVQVWLEDQDGNVDPNSRSIPVSLRFDDQVPELPKLLVEPGWLNANASGSIALQVELAGVDVPPLSGVTGYSYTLDGTEPDGVIEVLAVPDFERYPSVLELGYLGEGAIPVKVRAVSGAGVPSTMTGEAVVRIDRSRPDIEVRHQHSLDRWLRVPFRFVLTASDQESLSGMTPAPNGEPAERGGYIVWRVGDDTAVARGSSAGGTTEIDGHHTLRFKAVDVAGNESVEREVSFKIDRTGPVGRFRARKASDPTLLVADVEDATSGLADGWIEIRREGGGAFRRLASTLRGGVLSARLPDEGLPDGRYEVRAVVTDVAGNRTAIDATATGGDTTIVLPVRTGVALDARVERTAKKRCVGARRGKRAPRRVCRRGRTKLVRSVTVDHGRRVVARGALSSDGRPLVGMTVIVEGQTAGRDGYTPLGTVRTDGRGAFRRVIPAGPSRTIRFRFAGTGTLRPAGATVQTRVRARVRLKVDRRRLLNGQAVRFTGRLPGRPLPATGKLVALQAKVPGGWRTFATPRANARGRFRHRYRFTSTTGLRRYRFRAVVAAEPAYPYARGLSPTVAVVVRGR